MDHEQHAMSEYRETANADRYQAIPRLAGDIASGRAEDLIFFVKKEKSTMLPQAKYAVIKSKWSVGTRTAYLLS
ncbi:MAG: hypothetical protein ACLFVO_22700 [Chloroflexaceae bacterium]